MESYTGRFFALTMSREETRKLVDTLLANDRQEIYDGDEEPIEPKRAIRELARMRDSATIPALITLVERYEIDREPRNYIDYVVEVLGRMGTERAVELITRVLLAALENGDDCADTCVAWLREVGSKVAVPVLIRFIEANYQMEMAVFHAVAAMKGVRDWRLIPVLERLLVYPDPAVIAGALDRLREQDDGSVIEQIIPLLRYRYRRAGEQRGVRESALRALVRLLRDDPERLRRILVEHGIMGTGSPPGAWVRAVTKADGEGGWSAERVIRRRRKDNLVARREDGVDAELPSSLIDGLVRSYNEELTLEGNVAMSCGPTTPVEPGAVAVGAAAAPAGSSEALAAKVAMMLYEEGLIPRGQLDVIRRRCESLDESAKKIGGENHSEMLWTAGFDVFVSRAEKRADSGRVERLRSVLRGEGFSVTSERHGGLLLARSGRRSVIVIDSGTPSDSKKDDHWSGFSIRLLGDWDDDDDEDDDEAVAMLEQLWRAIEKGRGGRTSTAHANAVRTAAATNTPTKVAQPVRRHFFRGFHDAS
jgi:HEAT repeat protein